MNVWLLVKGEDHEGGEVLDVYASKEDAREDFLTEAAQIDRTFTLDNATQLDNGTITVHGGCDWLALEPRTVKGKLPLPA